MRNLFLGMVAIAVLSTNSAKAEITDCLEILSVPVIITDQGVHCLKKDLIARATSGNLIDIQTNNVTIDLNGFKLGGLGAGAATTARGIFASNRQNITIRNGTIRGFFNGVMLEEFGGISSGHLVEDLLLDQNRRSGAYVQGSGNVIRNNRVVDTGPSVPNDNAFGIFVEHGGNSVVANNVISGTSETSVAVGIYVLDATLVEVLGNSILDTKGAATTRGIEIGSSSQVTVINNRILNAVGTGTTGIISSAGSTGVHCIDNTIVGFVSSLSLDASSFTGGNNLIQ